jgi:hypothetical protein
MLATCAPRAWCKRLLNWEVFWGGLNLYARDGVVTHRRIAFEILREAGFVTEVHDEPSESELEALPKDDEEAAAVRRAAAAGRFDYVDSLSLHWGIQDGALPIGLMVAQARLDWELGELDAEISSGLVPDEWLEDADNTFVPDAHGEVRAHLVGLSFEVAAIEMLVPSASVPDGKLASLPTPLRTTRRAGGRPMKWDWEGAIAAVVAEANRNPDGLPDGYGAQTKIEKMMAEWFLERAADCPAESEIRKRAQKIVAEVEGRKT